MRRLLGPVGGPVMFFLTAALVFAGLGWVTVVALRVETAQREAAAQAELSGNLRVALRDLDSRVLPVLGVEDSRPYYHYTSADPLTGSTAGPTPLLAAPLPDWIRLHVQLDRAHGWDSPQVLAPDAVGRVALAWPDLPLRNNTPARAEALARMRANFAAPTTWDLLAARDRATPADDRPFSAPWLDPLVFVPPASSALKPPPPPDMVPVAVPPRPDTVRVFGWEFPRPITVAEVRRDQEASAQAARPPAFPPLQAPPGGAVGRTSPITEQERLWLDFRTRSGTISRAVQEARNAGLDFQHFNRNYPNQNQAIEPKKEAKEPGKDFVGPVDPTAEKLKKAGDAVKRLNGEQHRGSLTEHLATLGLGIDRRRGLDEVQRVVEEQRARDVLVTNELMTALAWSLGVARGTAGGTPVPAPNTVPPAVERPAPTAPAPLAGPPAVSIHTGPMRPQWITAADGTETLVLVRAAKIDNRIVYQGIVVDWAKLELVLKDEVKAQFPGAKLVPVRDPAGVSPDRAMTALPVQLDTGDAPAPPPARWTALRIGLVLAWVAALVAFVAVGFSGWSLIDLAERRIRFVSAVTHELRTPLTSLRLYLDLLMSGLIRDEAKKQEYLNTLATESDRLHRLIDNVLDFAKLEKRTKNGDMKPVRVGDLLDNLQQMWTDRVAEDNKQLLVVSALPSSAEVFTDPVMVHQIVGNLIDNARKYTREAQDNRIWLHAKPGPNGGVVFEVEDRGAGVPASERKSIFKPFRRGAQADVKAGGAGLGLALAKQWAEVLGGTVAYRSADGAPGACFRLELPPPPKVAS